MLPPYGKKIGFNLLYDEYFTIHYVTDKTLNPPDGNKLTTQSKRNVWIISINQEEPITDKSALEKLSCHKNTHGKSKVNMSPFRRKSY